MIATASVQADNVAYASTDGELRELSNRQLLCRLQLAMRGERAMTIKILRHLGEIERRKLYLDLGHGSMFDYCTRRLGYSSSAAWRRIQSARCIRRYPDLLPLLHNRELSLSTITLIAPILADHNKQEILERVRGRSHREVERVVSAYKPPLALRDRVQPVRVPAARPVEIDRVLFERELARCLPDGVATAGAGSGAAGVATEEKLFVQFLASEDLMEHFEEVKALLSHRCGEGTFEEVLAIVLADFLERYGPRARRRRRERREKTETQPAPDHTPTPENHCRRRQWEDDVVERRSRHIPAAVRDEVFTRDGGRCAYRAPDGTQCGSTKSLQIDHIRPFAVGGAHEPSNLRLLCAHHNRRVAEDTLGLHTMKRFRRRE